jgi:thiaminase/transcriptional activator TenA
LDVEKFKYWIRQDYLFLIDYTRTLAIACARSADFETLKRFAELQINTVKVERDLHCSYAAEYGISESELVSGEKSPTCQAYTDFLLAAAGTGDYAELVSAMLPCMWGFSEIGLRLAREGGPKNNPYEKWIHMYSDPAFTALAQWGRDLLDRLAGNLSGPHLDRLEKTFLLGSRLELAFWEMSWTMEKWPV